MGINEVIGDKRADILKSAERHGAVNVRLFGSVLRGDARPDSDVDLLIDCGPRKSPWFPGGFILDVERLLGRKVHVVTERMLIPGIKEQVLREARPL